MQEQTQLGECLTNLFVHLHRTLRRPVSQGTNLHSVTREPKMKHIYTFINKKGGLEEELVLETVPTGSKLKAFIYKHGYGSLAD